MTEQYSDNIEITSMRRECASDAFSLVCNIFVEASVLHNAVDITIDEYREYLHGSFDEMWRQGLSIIATDRTTNELVGCLLACDYAKQELNSAKVPAKLEPVNALLKTLDSAYRTDRKILPGQVMLVDMAVVKETFSGCGIYTRLREKAHRIGRDAGFQQIVGELSSAATQHLCVNRFRHKICAEIEFASFTYNNEKPFASIKEPASIILVEGQLV